MDFHQFDICKIIFEKKKKKNLSFHPFRSDTKPFLAKTLKQIQNQFYQ